MTAKHPDPQRMAHLAAIHVAAKQLIDRDTYVAIFGRIAPGHRSSADLDARQRMALLDELRRLGAARVAGGKRRASANGVRRGAPTSVAPDRAAMVRKVGALLADAKRPWNYAHSLARRMFGADRVEWCPPDQLHRLIAALEIDRRRRAKAPAKRGKQPCK